MRGSELLTCGLVVFVGAVMAVGQGGNAPARPAQPAPPAAAPADPSQKERLSYGVGFYLGEEIREGLSADQINVERDLVIKGFVDGLLGAQPAMDRQQLDAILTTVHEEMQMRTVKRLQAEDGAFRKLCEDNLAQSRAYLEKNAKQPGVQKTPEGVQYIVQQPGQGASPKPGDVVVLTYRTSLVDGTQVDAGAAKEVDLDIVRPGIAKVIMMMKPGAKWSVVFPPEAAYGLGGKPPIVGPNQALVAEVELIGVK